MSLAGEFMKFHGEGGIDRVIRSVFFPLKADKGVFVEVGAADPAYISISKHFRDSGWDVISIEPNPYFAKRHREAGNRILEYACGPKDEDNIEFEVVYPKVEGAFGNITYESFSAIKVKDKYKQNTASFYSQFDIRTIKVNMRRLDTLLADIGITAIDVLSVDVEGWELEVLAGLNFQIYAPKVLVIENLLKDINYRKVITGYGYSFICHMHPNEIYVKTGTFSGLKIITSRIYTSVFYMTGIMFGMLRLIRKFIVPKNAT